MLQIMNSFSLAGISRGRQMLGLPDYLRSVPVAHSLQRSLLGTLPQELILSIAEFLPISSAASFSISCRPIYHILGSQYLEQLKTTSSENEDGSECYEFLLLLQRQIPDHLACFHCKKLHAISKARRHAVYNGSYTGYRRWTVPMQQPERSMHTLRFRFYPRKLPECWKANHIYEATRWIHPNFSLTIFQMAMVRHGQGQDCTELLDLLSYKGKIREYRSWVCKTIAWAKIVNDSLFVRRETVYVLRHGHRIESLLDSGLLFHCPHQIGVRMEQQNIAGEILRRTAETWSSDGQLSWEKRRFDCYFCCTEFVIDIVRHEGEGVALSVNRWQDLGSGGASKNSKWASVIVDPSVYGDQDDIYPECRINTIITAFEPSKDWYDVKLSYQDHKQLFKEASKG